MIKILTYKWKVTDKINKTLHFVILLLFSIFFVSTSKWFCIQLIHYVAQFSKNVLLLNSCFVNGIFHPSGTFHIEIYSLMKMSPVIRRLKCEKVKCFKSIEKLNLTQPDIEHNFLRLFECYL